MILFGQRIRSVAIPTFLLACFIAGVWLVTSSNSNVNENMSNNVRQAVSDRENVTANDTDNSMLGEQSDISLSKEPSEPRSATTQNIQSTAPVPKDTTVPQTTPPFEPQTQPTVKKLSVTLQINGAAAGTVSIPDGSNHCDVLIAAKKSGVISDLELKYNETMKSYGVQVINGQGDSNIVWWVYIVNGKSPPLGCSHVLAKQNDIINWKYTGR